MDAPGLIRILTDASSPGVPEGESLPACRRAWARKRPCLRFPRLLCNEHLSTYARYGLEPIADPSADDALRAALPKLKGNQLIGVINSIGKRRDAKAGPALAKMMYGADGDVARAAAAALGSIGTSLP